ncbi:diguanylate cyclase [Prauserella marina]|uniref:PucR C-terminal helix-turn-helix domain-containing protein n=1 Tax=Prauserella marina TaxID=530584 RepID=A0A222VPT7_9PSEU|nr:GAF domain-containing protein [Prauserella marina]ASR35763.1 diguanylate cyclase [Prauserella marina]PWV84342.1 PucR-like helix-turn-helix protein [Prauserella marina]SDC24906.1 PucR C-terminal helix-turn-helix domain-containing protein [Prauserella marina]
MADTLPVDVVVGLLRSASAEREADVDGLLGGVSLAEEDAARIRYETRRLRATSERWRRRGQELAALFSSARELAQLRDVDELLGRLVERAHDLVGTDVTYLSEFDADSRELRVRTTLGTVAPSFLGLLVPPGVGLASQVVEGRRPCWTSKYAAMTQAPHDSAIDAAVAAEGLVSLLGVPLMAGEEVIGVLFAANRVEHAFSPEEISLLSAFADHAAIVLQTARLLARTQDSADEARRAYDQLARHVEAMERASEVHGDLTSLVLQGGEAPDVATALGRALRCHVELLDPESLEGPFADAVDRSRHSGRCTPAGDGAYAVAVLAGPALLGAFLLEEGDVEFGPVELRTAERAAQITALLNLKQDAVIEAEQRVRGDLLADMLSDDPGRRAGIATRARARGIRLDELRSVVVVSVPAELRREAVRALQRTAGPVGEHTGHVVALTGHADPAAASAFAHAMVSRAVRGPVLAVGASVTGADGATDDLRAQAGAASACVRILPSLGLSDTAVTADDYLPYTALFGPGEARVRSYVRRVIGPVLDWDAEHAGTLLPTLSAYLGNRMSPVATARALHLHKNTVLQRMERATELLGENWQEPDRLFRITVAVRLANLTKNP